MSDDAPACRGVFVSWALARRVQGLQLLGRPDVVPGAAVSLRRDAPRGGSASGDNYKQAALFIEFLRESKWKPDAFQLFLRSMGRVPRGDLQAIEGVFRSVYGADIAALEQAFIDYCKKR